jgi:hypothetical protein
MTQHIGGGGGTPHLLVIPRSYNRDPVRIIETSLKERYNKFQYSVYLGEPPYPHSSQKARSDAALSASLITTKQI